MGDLIRVLYVITDLSVGGAEVMLHKLLSRMSREKFEQAAISLTDRGALSAGIEILGFPVYAVGMKSVMPILAAAWRLICLPRRLKPDLTKGWKSHSNLAVP